MKAPIIQPANPARPYGVGLAYRYSFHDEAVKYEDEIDIMEISTEDYIIRERRINSDPNEALLRDALDRWSCVAHGISLSIGSVQDLNEHYMSGSKRFLEEYGIDVFSEHLAFHEIDGKDLTMFLCMPFEEIAVQWVKQNYYAVRRQLGRPFALENVTYFFPAPHSSLDEADFLRRVTEETDCTLLLDITNVFNNANNHNYDPYEFLDRLPLERVSQMHLAGGFQQPDGKWEDSHSHPVMDGVWPLYEEVLKRSPAEIVIVERDSRFNPFEEVLDDVRKARELFYQYRPSVPEGDGPIYLDETPIEVPKTTPLAPEFAGLRSYQRALMGRITDSGFRERYQQNPPEALKEFGLTEEKWVNSLCDIDLNILGRLQDSWDYIDNENQEIAGEYEQNEWAAWADILQSEGKSV
ncbi:MAG: DUF692 domain-containing protein [Verrucomicrobiales bacterium]|nr:DUF692 domain-containing protein [Verrucomicrobiales bacterium]